MNKINRTCAVSSIKIDKIGRISNYSNNKSIREGLIQMSENCCAFCNCTFSLSSQYTPHIEHYKPKKMFPNLEKVWHNLFASCPKCNEYKGDTYPEIKPLKPDTEEYDFDYWFEIKWETFEIIPNPLRNEQQQKRAEATIKWLGFNKDSRPQSRKLISKQFNGSNIEDWSYKFMLQRIS
jgi:uncharacterized protein (TIGR02646 family)